MRTLRFVIIPAVLFLLPGLLQAGWFLQNPLPQTNPLYSVCLIDENTGFAVGYYGTILKTTNGGVAWTIQQSEVTRSLLSVHFPVDAMTGYVVGDSGAILKTTNGGLSWSSRTGPR